MDPKETLRRARRIQARIDRRTAELDRLQKMTVYLSATSYDKPAVAQSAGRGPVEQMATSDHLDKLEQAIRRDIETLAQAKLEAITLIDSLDDPRMTEVLWEYYIQGAPSWEATADACGYTVRHCTRIHGRALQELRKMSLNVHIDPV